MLEHGFSLTIIFSYKGRIWSNTKLPTNYLSDFDQILPSYGKIRVRENPCSSIFYAWWPYQEQPRKYFYSFKVAGVSFHKMYEPRQCRQHMLKNSDYSSLRGWFSSWIEICNYMNNFSPGLKCFNLGLNIIASKNRKFRRLMK